MNVFVLNCGSSSVKVQMVDMAARRAVVGGKIERIGEPRSRFACGGRTQAGEWEDWIVEGRARDHREALTNLVDALTPRCACLNDGAFAAVGHRVVHGGDRFREAALIGKSVIESIRSAASLAPLHNAASLAGIELALDRWPSVPQVAIFDTAFHQTLPPHAFLYALPFELSERHKIRRYGFHGTSHSYLAKRAAAMLARPLNSLRLITLHLGNGASAAAIKDGKSIDTSMGLTPLEGLMMSSRCGDIDPAIAFHLHRGTGQSLDALETVLKSQSGLKGICGAADMRDVVRMAEAGDARAELALTMFCYRVQKYIGAYFAILGGVDAIIFSGGIGENSAVVRQRICAGLGCLGVALDGTRNQTAAGERELQQAGSAVKILVIPTNEELEIAEQTLACLSRASPTKESS